MKIDLLLADQSILYFGLKLFSWEMINHGFSINLNVFLKKTDLQYLRKNASLCVSININSKCRYFNGIIFQYHFKNTHYNDISTATIIALPWWYFLREKIHQRIFYQKTYKNLIGKILREHSNANFTLEKSVLMSDYCEYLTQYNESNYSFISRLLIELNLQYHFSQHREKHCMHIHNGNGFEQLQHEVKLSQQEICIQLQNNNSYLGQFKQTIRASTQCLLLASGAIIIHTKQAYLIHAIIHNISDHQNLPRSFSSNSEPYTNRCLLINTHEKAKQSNKFKRFISHIDHASVNLPENYMPNPYYTYITFPWDEHHTKRKIPLTHIYSGKQRGMHFIPKQASHLIIKYLHADPNQPISIGMLQEKNESDGVLYYPKIQLYGYSGKQHLLLDDKTQKMDLFSQQTMKFKAQKIMYSITSNVRIQADENLSIKAKDISFICTHEVHLKIANTEILINNNVIKITSKKVLFYC